MSNKNLAANGKEKQKSNSKKKILNEFHGNGVIEGLIPIPDNEEVDIQSAREVLESRSKKNLGKPYKVKVVGTETTLILKRKAVLGSAPREQVMLCNEVYRFFIFARDPKLVILVVPNKPNEKRAYLLLKMKDENQANQVCNVIQNGRKRLSNVSNVQPPTTQEDKLEMQENVTPVANEASNVEELEEGEEEDETHERKGRSSSPDATKKSESSRASSQERVENIPLVADTTIASLPIPAGDGRSESASSRKVSEQNHPDASKSPSQTSSKHRPDSKTPNSQVPIKTPSASQQIVDETICKSTLQDLHSAAPIDYLSDSSSGESSTPRSLPRQPLEEVHGRRKRAPVTEEMEFTVSPDWKPHKPLQLYRGDDLKKALHRDMYDKDWTVDVKIIETVGDFNSRISDTGNVYMFTAHHLVPENYCHIECSSSSEDEDEEINQRSRSKNIKAKSSRASHSTSSSSEDGDIIHDHPDYPKQAIYT